MGDKEVYENFKHLYEGLIKGDKAKVLRQYEKLPAQLPKHLTVLDDTLLHIAVYMDQENIARELFSRCPQNNLDSRICDKNGVGDTILHEVAAANMVSLAGDLLGTAPQLLSTTNARGETPLFRAAHNGHREMFNLLAFAVHLKDKDNLQRHLIRDDNTNILHMTILAEFFDLAFLIAKKYPDLVLGKDISGKIGLQLLSSNPSAFMSGRNYGLLKRFIFNNCIPASEDFRKKEGNQEEDVKEYYELDSSDHEDQDNPKPKKSRFTYTSVCKSIIASALTSINISIWTFLRGGWPMMERMYIEYRKHESALRLAKLLVKTDTTWDIILSPEDKGKIYLGGAYHPQDEGDGNKDVEDKGKISLGPDYHPEHEGDGNKDGEDEEAAKSLKKRKGKAKGGHSDIKLGIPNPNIEPAQLGNSSSSGIQNEKSSTSVSISPRTLQNSRSPPTSLLIATSTGIVEIVNEILEVYPQAVEHVSDDGQNILHIAIKHRQLEIFRLVKKKALPKSRLVRRLDNNGYSLLHHVGDVKYYTGGTLPGPTLQLQEELRWFERVRKIIPSHFEMHRSYESKETAQEFFRKQHSELLKDAKEWLKRTSESCSTVAGLIATVAFAAAYTVPGGSNEDTGVPILLHDPFFLVFTVMDVLSLASSLTSVVMFLSILTSPFQFEDFRYSLPRKLTYGFTFLFFSVAVTMLAFAATIVLIIHLKKRWITTLIYSLAFLPVTVFALLQFPLYLAFMNTLKSSRNLIRFYLRLVCRCVLHSQD